MDRIKDFFERFAFGVCAWLGEKMGIESSRVRIFFIYSSFLTFGSPLLIYLALAFLLNVKNYIKTKRHPVWYL